MDNSLTIDELRRNADLYMEAIRVDRKFSEILEDVKFSTRVLDHPNRINVLIRWSFGGENDWSSQEITSQLASDIASNINSQFGIEPHWAEEFDEGSGKDSLSTVLSWDNGVLRGVYPHDQYNTGVIRVNVKIEKKLDSHCKVVPYTETMTFTRYRIDCEDESQQMMFEEEE